MELGTLPDMDYKLGQVCFLTFTLPQRTKNVHGPNRYPYSHIISTVCFLLSLLLANPRYSSAIKNDQTSICSQLTEREEHLRSEFNRIIQMKDADLTDALRCKADVCKTSHLACLC